MNQDLMKFILDRNKLSKNIKDGAYVINLNEYANIRTNRTALYVSNNDAIYFKSFGVEHVPKEIEKFIGNKSIQTIIHRTQANNSIRYKYFCIVFIDCMLAGKNLIEYTSSFSPYNLEK